MRLLTLCSLVLMCGCQISDAQKKDEKAASTARSFEEFSRGVVLDSNVRKFVSSVAQSATCTEEQLEFLDKFFQCCNENAADDKGKNLLMPTDQKIIEQCESDAGGSFAENIRSCPMIFK